MPKTQTGDMNVGCNFDSITAKAIHGKKVILMLFAKDGKDLLALSGQTGTTFSVESETSEAQTKDDGGEWSVKFQGVKSWSASCDALFTFDDPGRNAVVKAFAESEVLCIGLYKQETVPGGKKYTPIRKGLAIVTGEEVEAPSDDNMTGSFDFEGTGALWMIENATAEEVEKATITITETDDTTTEG